MRRARRFCNGCRSRIWKTWLFELYPLFLIVYDAKGDRAYWLDVQEYVQKQKLDWEDVRTMTLRVPASQLLTAETILEMRKRKNLRVTDSITRRGFK